MADEGKPSENTGEDENLDQQPSVMDLTNNHEEEAEKGDENTKESEAAGDSVESDKNASKSDSKSSVSKSGSSGSCSSGSSSGSTRTDIDKGSGKNRQSSHSSKVDKTKDCPCALGSDKRGSKSMKKNVIAGPCACCQKIRLQNEQKRRSEGTHEKHRSSRVTKVGKTKDCPCASSSLESVYKRDSCASTAITKSTTAGLCTCSQKIKAQNEQQPCTQSTCEKRRSNKIIKATECRSAATSCMEINDKRDSCAATVINKNTTTGLCNCSQKIRAQKEQQTCNQSTCEKKNKISQVKQCPSASSSSTDIAHNRDPYASSGIKKQITTGLCTCCQKVRAQNEQQSCDESTCEKQLSKKIIKSKDFHSASSSFTEIDQKRESCASTAIKQNITPGPCVCCKKIKTQIEQKRREAEQKASATSKECTCEQPAIPKGCTCGPRCPSLSPNRAEVEIQYKRRNAFSISESFSKPLISGPSLSASKANKSKQNEQVKQKEQGMKQSNAGVQKCTCGTSRASLLEISTKKNEEVRRKAIGIRQSDASVQPCVCVQRRPSLSECSSASSFLVNSSIEKSCGCSKSSASSCSSSSSSGSCSQTTAGSICQCCHCIHCRKMESVKRSAAQQKGEQLRFFLQNLLFDMQSFETSFKAKQLELADRMKGTQVKKYEPEYPIKILDVSELGPTSLLINWDIQEQDDIHAIHVYVDDLMVNQFFSPQRSTAAIHDIDIKKMHRICVVARPKQKSNQFIECICNNIMGKHDLPPAQPQRSQPKQSWLPGRFTYMPETGSCA